MPHRILTACLAAALAALAAVPSSPLAEEPATEAGSAAPDASAQPASPGAAQGDAAPPAAAEVGGPAETPPAPADAAPVEGAPPAAEAALAAASPAETDAAPGGRRLQIPAVAPAAQRIDWYRPARLDEADANLPWNRSIFGSFDPWTKQKVTFLFQHHSLALSLPAEEGMMEYGDEGEEEEANAYPSGRFSATYPGVRIENGNWSLAVATASGTVRWEASGDETEPEPAFDMRATTYEAIIARGFGAWAIFDGGSRDFRVGISWPELYLRVVYGEFTPEILEGGSLQFGILGAGVSLLGVRMTVGDALFAEVRAGDLSVHQAVSYIELGDDVDNDILLQRRAGFELRPMLRIGFAL